MVHSQMVPELEVDSVLRQHCRLHMKTFLRICSTIRLVGGCPSSSVDSTPLDDAEEADISDIPVAVVVVQRVFL